MLFFIPYKSWLYRISKSPTQLSWAFLMILHVPRLLIEQCSTDLISLDEQSD